MATPYVQLIIEIVIVIENDYPPMFLLNYFVSSYIQLLLEFITDIQLFGFSIKSIFLSFHKIHEFYYLIMNTLSC